MGLVETGVGLIPGGRRNEGNADPRERTRRRRRRSRSVSRAQADFRKYRHGQSFHQRRRGALARISATLRSDRHESRPAGCRRQANRAGDGSRAAIIRRRRPKFAFSARSFWRRRSWRFTCWFAANMLRNTTRSWRGSSPMFWRAAGSPRRRSFPSNIFWISNAKHSSAFAASARRRNASRTRLRPANLCATDRGFGNAAWQQVGKATFRASGALLFAASRPNKRWNDSLISDNLRTMLHKSTRTAN